jgi:4-amino-4-deoxy-L-arabinose transferase-like glycosyltransferase
LSPLAWLVAILVVAVAVRLPFTLGGIMDWDEGVYWQSLRAMSSGHALYSEVYSSQPPAFLLGLHPVYALLGHSFLAARVVMLLWCVVALVAAFFAGKALVGTCAGLVAAALLAIDPIVFRQSVVIQAEGPAIALGLIAVGCAARARSDGGRRGDVLALVTGAALALGVLSKFLDIAAALPVVMLLAVPSTEAGTTWQRRCAVAAGGAFLAAAAVLLPLAGEWRQMVDQSVGLHLASHILEVGGWTVEMVQAAARETPLALLAVAGGLILARRAPVVAAAMAAWLAAALVAIVLVHPLWPHHLSAAVPPMVIAGGAAIDAAAGAAKRTLVVAGALVAVAGLLVGLGIEAYLLRTASQAAPGVFVDTLRAVTKEGEVIVTDDQYTVALAGLDVPPELVDTSLVRILSSSLSLQAVEDAAIRSHARGVFFATGRLQHIDGFREWAAAHFTDVYTFSDGRAIYLLRRGG